MEILVAAVLVLQVVTLLAVLNLRRERDAEEPEEGGIDEETEKKNEELREKWEDGMNNMLAWTYEDAVKAAGEERANGRI